MQMKQKAQQRAYRKNMREVMILADQVADKDQQVRELQEELIQKNILVDIVKSKAKYYMKENKDLKTTRKFLVGTVTILIIVVLLLL